MKHCSKCADKDYCSAYGCSGIWKEEVKMELKHTIEDCLALVKEPAYKYKSKHGIEYRYCWNKLSDTKYGVVFGLNTAGRPYYYHPNWLEIETIEDVYKLFSDPVYRKERGLEKEGEILAGVEEMLEAAQAKILELQDRNGQLQWELDIANTAAINYKKRLGLQEKKPETKDWTAAPVYGNYDVY